MKINKILYHFDDDKVFTYEPEEIIKETKKYLYGKMLKYDKEKLDIPIFGHHCVAIVSLTNDAAVLKEQLKKWFAQKSFNVIQEPSNNTTINVVKQLHSCNNTFEVGDIVKLHMTKEFVCGSLNRNQIYEGVIKEIYEDCFSLTYGKNGLYLPNEKFGKTTAFFSPKEIEFIEFLKE